MSFRVAWKRIKILSFIFVQNRRAMLNRKQPRISETVVYTRMRCQLLSLCQQVVRRMIREKGISRCHFRIRKIRRSETKRGGERFLHFSGPHSQFSFRIIVISRSTQAGFLTPLLGSTYLPYLYIYLLIRHQDLSWSVPGYLSCGKRIVYTASRPGFP